MFGRYVKKRLKEEGLTGRRVLVFTEDDLTRSGREKHNRIVSSITGRPVCPDSSIKCTMNIDEVSLYNEGERWEWEGK